ncbi:MAG: hypothetical protein ABI690_16860 [Chloroflexota bacterium]
MIWRWVIKKVPRILGVFMAVTALTFMIGRIAPPRHLFYMLARQMVDPVSVMMLDVDLHIRVRFLPQPSLAGNAVGGWALSPDGKQFVVSNSLDLMVMDNRGRFQRWLTQDKTNNYAPAWSPDGTKIAFVSNGDKDSEIYVIGIDGSNPIQLTHNDVNDFTPSWSPDGKSIIFVTYAEADSGISVEIYVINADGSNPKRLTDNKFPDVSPLWSPDGKHILFTSDRDQDAAGYQLYMMNPDGSDQHLLVDTPVNVIAPRWSPDGQFILFQTNSRDQVYIVNADGSGFRQLDIREHPLFGAVWFMPDL